MQGRGPPFSAGNVVHWILLVVLLEAESQLHLKASSTRCAKTSSNKIEQNP
jgi:hypothetical protein